MIISMKNAEKLSAEENRGFLEASEEVAFEGQRRGEVYEWLTRMLRQQGYREQGKRMRELLRIWKLTGLSRAQVSRLVGRCLEHGEVKKSAYKRHHVASRFTRADIECSPKSTKRMRR